MRLLANASVRCLDDVQKRFSAWYIIGCVASALSGILCFGFSQMNGLQGHSGWMWIFIMQAIVGAIQVQIVSGELIDSAIGHFSGWYHLLYFPCRLSR
jgi:hypothetical protein